MMGFIPPSVQSSIANTGAGGIQPASSSWNWGDSGFNPENWGNAWDTTNPETGMVDKGYMSGGIAAAGAITNAYLGYQGLEEARRNREMQEKYAAANLYNTAQGYNANVRDVASNNAAINRWSNDRQAQYVADNQAKDSI